MHSLAGIVESHQLGGAGLRTGQQTEDMQGLAPEVLICTLSGILFKPRVLCSDAVGERASGCEALLHSPRLCQGLWGLEVSRNTLGFRDVLEKQMTMALTSVSPARAKSQ